MALISERGRALILAAAVLDRPNADPDDDVAVLARQLTRAQEEIDGLSKEIEFLRSTTGAVSQGQSFDDIAKILPKRVTTQD